MPRSSRHRSSNHSSRDARGYSDSEKDATSKDRRSNREDCSSVKISKESASVEKRKFDCNSKGSGNGDYLEEYSSSSKRRKEKDEDGVSDRWSGGDGVNKNEGTKKLKEKSSSELKIRRRDESAAEVYVEIEQISKKSSGKGDGRHRESTTQKEEKERDGRVEEVNRDKFTDGDDLLTGKQVFDKIESYLHDLLLNSESENLPDRQFKRKQDGSGNGNKHRDDIGDNKDRRLSLKEDIAKDGRLKDEKYKDKYSEAVVKKSRYQEDKQRDECAAKYHINNRSDDKHLRDDQNITETKLKKYKPQDGHHDQEHDNDRDHDHDCESYQHYLDCCCDGNHDRERELDHEHDWDCDQDRERDHDHERNLDCDGIHMYNRGARPKNSRGRKRSPEDHDDTEDAKVRGKTSYLEVERKSSRRNVESDTDWGRPQLHQAHSNNRGASPNIISEEAADDYRQFKQEMECSNDVRAQRSKSISSGETIDLPGSSHAASKYRYSEKLTEMNDGNSGELAERLSCSKASPRAMVDRSPSSTSLESSRDRNRSSVSQSVEIEKLGRRSSAVGARGLSSADDRPSRDAPLDKSLADESTSFDSSFNNRNIQSNSALIPPSSAFRGGVGSPSFLGSLEEDSRIDVGARSKRNGDPKLGRGQGNAQRGAPNWSSPVPNGYIPFHHGPSHGGFHAMMPQFLSSLFGIRRSMEVNHSGIPYHFAEADRFHLYPFGWQNMIDGSGPSHLHGWDGNNGVYRDESHIHGVDEWNQNGYSFNGRKWESSTDIWKGQNGDLNLEFPSASLKDDLSVPAPGHGISVGQRAQRLQNESNHLGVQLKIVEAKLAVTPTKEFSESSPKTIDGKIPDSRKLSCLDSVTYPYHVYFSKLDISIELSDPELYNQCMSLHNMEQCAIDDEGAAPLVNLKDGARAVPKSSLTLLKSSLLPMTSDSVFQRSMDIYKRQIKCLSRFSVANDGIVDVIAAPSVEGQAPDDNLDEKRNLNHPEEMADAYMKLDEKKAIAVSVADVQVLPDVASSQEVDVVANAPDLMLESSGEACKDDIPEKPIVILDGDEDKVSSKMADSEAPPLQDFVSASNAVSNAPKVLFSDGNNIDGIGKGGNHFNRAEVVQVYGDARCGALLFKEGATKASADLMPGSNESESVMLSRIYHSPESTH